MFRRNIFGLMVLLLILWCVGGCTAPNPTSTTTEPTTAPTAAPSSAEEIVVGCVVEMVQIDGRLFSLVKPIVDGFEPEADQIAGYTTALVDEMPDADGECNVFPVGMAYAKWSTEEYPDTYIIQCPARNGDLIWCLLRPLLDGE